MKKNIIKIWKKTGSLENLSLSKVERCAESLNNISKLILSESIDPILNKTDKIFGKGYVIETIIPIVRHLHNYDFEKFPNEKWLFKDYIKFLNNKKNSIKNKDIVNLYCESLIKKLKKNNKGEI